METAHATNPLRQYILSTWKELEPLPRAIIATFLGLGFIFFIYMAYRLIYTLVTY